MQTSTYYANNSRTETFHERRRSLLLSDAKPAMEWDRHKIMYFALTMLGGGVVWAFVFGAICYSIK